MLKETQIYEINNLIEIGTKKLESLELYHIHDDKHHIHEFKNRKSKAIVRLVIYEANKMMREEKSFSMQKIKTLTEIVNSQ